jgi:hypothetical protein
MRSRPKQKFKTSLQARWCLVLAVRAAEEESAFRTPTSPNQIPPHNISEPITTIYLTLQEYETFSKLPGKASKKQRYLLNEGSLDRYVQPEIGDLIFEVEFSDEAVANNYTPPSFVSDEITGLEKYSGFALAQESEKRNWHR